MRRLSAVRLCGPTTLVPGLAVKQPAAAPAAAPDMVVNDWAAALPPRGRWVCGQEGEASLQCQPLDEARTSWVVRFSKWIAGRHRNAASDPPFAGAYGKLHATALTLVCSARALSRLACVCVGSCSFCASAPKFSANKWGACFVRNRGKLRVLVHR